MKIKGLVEMINHQCSLVAVLIDHGYTVFKILGYYYIKLDDEIFGNLDDHSDVILRNVTKDIDIEVHIEAIQATKEALKVMIFT